MGKEVTLEELANQLFDAKQRENAARDERIAVEEKIAELVETAANGSKTVPVGNGLKITVKRGLSYKANIDAIRNLDNVAGLPIKLVPAEWVFDEKEYERILMDEPKKAAILAKHVEVKPKKVAVTLKVG